MRTGLLYNLLEENIKQNLPSNLEQKLLSYQDNCNKWLYYGALINQKQNELRCLDIKAWHGYFSIHDLLSRDEHQKALSEYHIEHFKYFRLMCCDALSICNDLFCQINRKEYGSKKNG